MATPKFLAVGGRDLLILDAKNALWRWRASNDAGKGTTNRITVNGASQWGNDILAIGTYLRDTSRGLYNLYVIDPSEQQIRAYPPSGDGSGFPAKSSAWLATARAVDQMTVAVHRRRHLRHRERRPRPLHLRQERRLGARASPATSCCARRRARCSSPGAGERNEGRVYTFDRSNDRLAGLRQAQRRLRRAVPARGRRRLGGPARDVHHPGRRGPARHAGLAVEGRPSTRPCSQAAPETDGASPSPSGGAERLAVGLAQPLAGGDRRDPAPRREPDPADAGHHPRAHRRVRARLRVPAAAHGAAAASRRSRRSSRAGAWSPPSSSRPSGRARSSRWRRRRSSRASSCTAA